MIMGGGSILKGRTNHEWREDLREPVSNEALEDLRALLVRGLRAALSSQVRGDLDSVVEDFVQEALVKILKSLETFRGESRFTTWAHKITIHVALTELRRRRWQDVSLQDLIENQEGTDFTPVILTDPTASPERTAAQHAALEMVQRLIDEELTDRQREALMAILVGGMPIEEVAQRMGTNRNALYKLLHDARQRLKKRMLASEGITPQEVMDLFGDK